MYKRLKKNTVNNNNDMYNDVEKRLSKLETVARKEMVKLLNNEENTKNVIIIPLLEIMGYSHKEINHFNSEVKVGRTGKKVDYTLKAEVSKEHNIIVEAKAINENLDKHEKQIEYYFNNFEEAEVAILTNGLETRFYIGDDNDKTKAKMTTKPYFILKLVDNFSLVKYKYFISLFRLNYNKTNVWNMAQTKHWIDLVTDEISNINREPDDKFVNKIWKNIKHDEEIDDKIFGWFKNEVVKVALDEYHFNIDEYKREVEAYKDKESKGFDEYVSLFNNLETILLEIDRAESHYILKEDSKEVRKGDLRDLIIIMRVMLEPKYNINKIKLVKSKSYYTLEVPIRKHRWLARISYRGSKIVTIQLNNAPKGIRTDGATKIRIKSREDIIDLIPHIQDVIYRQEIDMEY